MDRRNTVQKELVLKAVTDLHGHVTADEIYNYVSKEHPNIGKGTVYRNLSILAESGAVLKIEIPDGPDVFDFTLKEHYHAKCVRCGKVSDVDMDVFPDLVNRIRDTKGMKFLGYSLIFKGICSECLDKAE